MRTRFVDVIFQNGVLFPHGNTGLIFNGQWCKLIDVSVILEGVLVQLLLGRCGMGTPICRYEIFQNKNFLIAKIVSLKLCQFLKLLFKEIKFNVLRKLSIRETILQAVLNINLWIQASLDIYFRQTKRFAKQLLTKRAHYNNNSIDQLKLTLQLLNNTCTA